MLSPAAPPPLAAAASERPALHATAPDPLAAGQAHLGQIGWTPPPRGGARPLVAVLDTGVDPSSPDLAGVVLTGAGRSFVAASPDPTSDPEGHGTHVAGIIAASTGNGVGGSGVAAARILPVTVADASGRTTASALVRGLAYASARGARVINISFGGRGFSKVEQDAIDAAALRGALIVVAAGNTGGGATPDYPGAYRQVLAVGALGASGRPLNVSARGPQVALAAPGEAILSTAPGGSPALVPRTGTSMAAAVVSGAAARIIAARPGLTAQQVREILETSARDVPPTGPDPGTGAGRARPGGRPGGARSAAGRPRAERRSRPRRRDPAAAAGGRPGPAHRPRPHRLVERSARRLRGPARGRPAAEREPPGPRGGRPRPGALAPRRARRQARPRLRPHLAGGRLARAVVERVDLVHGLGRRPLHPRGPGRPDGRRATP